MTVLQLLHLVLSLASYLARHVERAKAERAFADAFLLAFRYRIEAAVAARDAIESGRLPDDPGPDPYRRD